MKKNKFLLLLISFVLFFSNTAEGSAYEQHFFPASEMRKVLSSSENKETLSETKPESKTIKMEKGFKLSAEEIDLLARLVHAEAGGEPFQGKVGVAATVLNRVRDAYYPDTIREVIYQQDHGFQYCTVRNGRINQPADNISFQAVKKAVDGQDPTGGALSFYNPVKSYNYWIQTRIYCKRIENHLFVR